MTREDAKVLKVLCLVRCPVDVKSLSDVLGGDMSARPARVALALGRLEGEGMVRSSPPDQCPVGFSASPKGYAAWIAMAQAALPR